MKKINNQENLQTLKESWDFIKEFYEGYNLKEKKEKKEEFLLKASKLISEEDYNSLKSHIDKGLENNSSHSYFI